MKRKTYLLALLTLGCFTSYAQSIPSSGLLASYAFDGNTNDGSTNGFHLMSKGTGLTADRYNRTNKALLLDSAISYAYANIGSQISEITVSFWYNSAGQVQPYPHFFDYGNYNFRCHLMSGNIYNSNDRNGILTETYNPNANEMRTRTKPGDNVWVHLTVSFSKSAKQQKIYINGAVVDSMAVGTGDLDLDDDTLNFGRIFRAGSLADRNTTQFKGAIDDILVYSRALTSAEVNSIYNYNPTASVRSLVEAENKITVYPNPTTDELAVEGVEIGTGTTVKIYSLDGKEVLSSNLARISLAELAEGVYILRVVGKDSEIVGTQRIIKL